jgi:hypothetical protein
VRRHNADSPRTVNGAVLLATASAGALAVQGPDGGRVALGLSGAVVARPDIEAQRGAAALRIKGEPTLPMGVLMTELDGGTWRRPATGGETQRRVRRGARQREANGDAARVSPSGGVASSMAAWQHRKWW